MHAINIITNNARKIKMKNYYTDKKEKHKITLAKEIEEIHQILQKNEKIKIHHCYSHTNIKGEITEGNKLADIHAGNKLKEIIKQKGKENQENKSQTE